MGYIPEDILQQIRDAADIRQIVQEYVPLKKRGKNWVGLCPFHPDKDPSFSVNEDKQIFYCFGCGEGGNVFKFLMKIQGLSFVEAALHLAQRLGIEIPERPVSRSRQKTIKEQDGIIEINHLAADFFSDLLLNSSTGLDARSYLEERGLSQKTIEHFSIGWAEDSWDKLVSFLEKKGKPLELAEKAGLIIKRTRAPGYYDRFRGRIIFPIRDHRGRIVAFGGRIIVSSPHREQPKYINSPESQIYHKGKVLYGLFHNKSPIRKAGTGIIVEGYMDVVSLWQAGIHEAVGTLGTALTEDHARRLKGIIKDWILLFDADEAGLKAASRALPICYKFNIRPKVLCLPDGEDPDSFVREEGPAGLRALMEKAPSGIDFLLEQGKKRFGTTTDGKAQLIDSVLESVSQVADPVRKSLLIGHIAQKVGVREESLWQKLQSMNKVSSRMVGANGGTMASKNRHGHRPMKTISKVSNKAEEKLLGFLLCYPQFIVEFLEEGLDLWLSDRGLLALWESMVNLYNMAGRCDLSSLCSRLEDAAGLKALAMRLSAEFPPCDDREAMMNDLKRFCQTRKKKALRMHLLEEMRAKGMMEPCEDILRKLQGLI